MLEKTFNPQVIEERLYKKWEQCGAFTATRESKKDPFVIMMPPPNVTGNLHMGHALNYTLQDVLVRYQRMKGKDVLWLPGTDHAGIATQSVVERQLEAEGLDRCDLGREKFLERVWQWKEQSGGAIVAQQKRLGISADWSRQRFTLDEGLNRAVREVFVRLYKEDLIYRDNRLVNWDPKLLTAVSDLEVETVTQKGHFWHIRYPLVEENEDYIVVATTRPETLFGDMAVAIHPEDPRYQKWIGKKVKLPLTDREIPIIADFYSDPEKGTGAVKITPAHDFNDFEVGKRHQLNQLTIMDIHGHMNESVPKEFQGLDRFKARKEVVAALEAQGLLDHIEDKEITLPYGEKSGVVLEPRLTKQWFVDAAVLAKPALEAVETGKTTFVPTHWEATYFEWLRNIQPWCISRQIWWGHQIPVWYAPDETVFVALSSEEAHAEATRHYGQAVSLTQDTDVLDTWFSSALWPFSTLGWPDQTEDLKRYYPGDVLVTGFDIIFFWVARMMMMGLHFMNEVPFKTVYINALVRDEKGQKMSKSKGNVIDPLVLMDQYGADALRFSMAALSTPGVDVKFSNAQVEGYRNFCTKIWNVARFCEQNECHFDPQFDPMAVRNPLNQWIVHRLFDRATALSHALDSNRFDLAATILYQFVWAEFADWYIEFVKGLVDSADKEETQHTTTWVLSVILHLAHPFIPFLTEELWDKFFHQDDMLITASWPEFQSLPQTYQQATQDVTWLIELISRIRGVRAQVNIPAGARITLGVLKASDKTQNLLKTYGALIQRLARIETLDLVIQDKPLYAAQTISLIQGETTYIIPVGNLIDIQAEIKRLQKSLIETQKEKETLARKLSNADFVARAPQDIIAKNQGRFEELSRTETALQEILEALAI